MEVELRVFKLNVLAGSSFDETSSRLIIARASGAVLFSRAVSCFYNRHTPETERERERKRERLRGLSKQQVPSQSKQRRRI